MYKGCGSFPILKNRLWEFGFWLCFEFAIGFPFVMQAILVAPLVEAAVVELLILLGIVAASVAAVDLAKNTQLPAKIRQWLLDHAAEFDKHSKLKEPREPTPVTTPSLFDAATINSKKVFLKKGIDEVWEADLLHCTHFEVYTSKKDFGKGARNRAVWLDGRLKLL
jgi:hypothetical protein